MKPHPHSDLHGKVTGIILPVRWASTRSGELCPQETALVRIYVTGTCIYILQVESISQKRTIAFLNHFVSHTASFLNRFSCVCEEKLEHMSNRLQQLEITMNLLDAKVRHTKHSKTFTVKRYFQRHGGYLTFSVCM